MQALKKTWISSGDIIDPLDSNCQPARLTRSRAALVCPYASIPILHPLPAGCPIYQPIICVPKRGEERFRARKYREVEGVCRIVVGRIPIKPPWPLRGGRDSLTTPSRTLIDLHLALGSFCLLEDSIPGS
jgi:hypothetical protein